ncbi:MAG: hypothetical protein CL424_04130 [Acidimicrobiaceae bacterium]|nr:hypothetical protein [Acidimicrobiaceae bacterium]
MTCRQTATPDMLYVVRHAEAGLRVDEADDHLRALSASGRHQARALADLLAEVSSRQGTGQGGAQLVSSPFIRCMETLGPLAARLRCTVVASDALAEGADISAMLTLLRALPTGSVACTHGDMLTALGALVADDRSGHPRPLAFDKGVVWVLSRRGATLALIDEIPAPHVCVELASTDVDSRTLHASS